MKAAAEPTPGLSHSARNQAPLAAASSGPTALPGRRAQNASAQAISAQPAPSRATAPPSDVPANEKRRVVSRDQRARRRRAPAGRPEHEPKRHVPIVAHGPSDLIRAGPCAGRGLSLILTTSSRGSAPMCRHGPVVTSNGTDREVHRCRRDESPDGRQSRCSQALALALAALRRLERATRPAEPRRSAGRAQFASSPTTSSPSSRCCRGGRPALGRHARIEFSRGGGEMIRTPSAGRSRTSRPARPTWPGSGHVSSTGST